MNAIRVEQLTRKFGDFTAVNSIDFEVPSGQVFGFLGPNGSGKTTTIRMLLGLLPPTSGTAYVLGQDIRQGTRAIVTQMGYMSQKFSLYRDLTVSENLRFFGRGYGLRNSELRDRMAFAIEMAGLRGHENTTTRELSGGWAQRLALGAAIMHRPKLVFLDEPTAGVDPVSRRDFWELLYQLAQTGTTIFVTTHYMDEAEHCENLAFIYYGDIIAQGAPEQIVKETIDGDVLAFHPTDPPHAMALINDAIVQDRIAARSVSLFGAAVHVVTLDLHSTRAFIDTELPRQGLAVGSYQVEQPRLEDAFIMLVEQADRRG